MAFNAPSPILFRNISGRDERALAVEDVHGERRSCSRDLGITESVKVRLNAINCATQYTTRLNAVSAHARAGVDNLLTADEHLLRIAPLSAQVPPNGLMVDDRIRHPASRTPDDGV